MVARLSFRIRTLLVLLLVALPPLVAFGIFALATTSDSHARGRAAAAEEALERATATLGAAIRRGEEASRALAGDAELAAAAVRGDGDTVAARYAELAGGELAGWSVLIVGGASRLEVASLEPTPAVVDGFLQGTPTGAPAAGPLVAPGRLLVLVAAPLTAAVEGTAGLRVVAWRDATGDTLSQMQIASGGSVAVEGGGARAVSGDRASELLALLDGEPGIVPGGAGTAEARSPSIAVAPLALADGGAGRVAVVATAPPAGFAAVGLGPALSVAGSLAVLWAVLLSIGFARWMGGQLRRLAEAAERVRTGEYPSDEVAPGGDELGALAAVQQRLAASLEERNRQIADLATQVTALPLGEDPRAVARGVAAAAASVTREPVWTLAVLRSDAADLLPPGRYGDGGFETDGGWLHGTWRSLREAIRRRDRARLVDTPDGPFVAALVAADGPLDAVLIAPWAGRRPPSAAELDLFALLAEHAATALDHAILYGRLRAQAGQLERLASIQTDFLRGVTHDLQTPLTSISILSSELRARPSLDAAARDDLRSIEEQAERLRRMVAQLLVVSRLEAGAVKPRQEVFRARGVIERAWRALRPADRSLEIMTDGTDHLVIADPDRLEQALWSLLENAIRYGTPGSPVGVRVGSRPREESEPALGGGATSSELVAEIEVIDEGIGMDPETQRRAFEQFYRSDVARALVPDGSGIGLYAARGLVEAMGGTLTVASAPGIGSRFLVSLPGEPARDADSPAPIGPARRSRRRRPAAAGHPSRPRCSEAGSTPRTAP